MLFQNQKVVVLYFCLSIFLTINTLSGCASTRKTTTQTTVTSDTRSTSVPVSSETTQTKTETQRTQPSHSPGILSGLFGAIGAILAFPFKVIGAVIEAIF